MASLQPESTRASGESICCRDLKRRRIATHEAGTSSGICVGSVRRSPQFCDLVFTPLSAAIDAWEAVNTRHHSLKFNILASVVKWGKLKQTKGMHTSLQL